MFTSGPPPPPFKIQTDTNHCVGIRHTEPLCGSIPLENRVSVMVEFAGPEL